MRTIATAVLTLTVASCSSSPLPNSFTGTPSGAGALACVADQLDDRGYRTVGGGPNDSFVRMERTNDEAFWLNIIGIEDSIDVLDATTQGGQLRVVAYSQLMRGGERESAAPSDDARREARDAVDECT